jgi:hypothetical protein
VEKKALVPFLEPRPIRTPVMIKKGIINVSFRGFPRRNNKSPKRTINGAPSIGPNH